MATGRGGTSVNGGPEELPLANYYSRIVATSVHGEVLHCKES